MALVKGLTGREFNGELIWVAVEMRQLKGQGATSCHCPETSHFKANSSFFMKIELNNKVSNDTFESHTKVRNNSEFLERNQVQGQI